MRTTSAVTGKAVAAALTLTAAGVLLSACSAGGGSSYGSGSSTPSPKPTPTAMAASGKTVTATETEYKIALSGSKLTPGTYTFKVMNRGQATHALEIDGPGVEDRKSATVSPGQSTSLTVKLRKGSYEVYCPVDGHKGLGMDTRITVG